MKFIVRVGCGLVQPLPGAVSCLAILGSRVQAPYLKLVGSSGTGEQGRVLGCMCREGMSNILMIESNEAVVNHRESEEKVYTLRCTDGKTYNRPPNPQLFCESRCPKDAQRDRHT